MRFILVFLFGLHLITLVQSQYDGGGSSQTGGGDVSSVQPSNPATSAGPTQTSDGGNDSQPNGPTATSETAGQTTQASATTGNTSPTTVPTYSQSQSNGDASHTHTYNSASQTANPTTNGSDATNTSGSGSGSNNSSNDNVGAIAGGVVGGVVGLALIGGLLAWLNRRGGCTSRTKRRRHDTIDDFALNTDDSGNNNRVGVDDTTNSASPFQRRMAPMAQNSYLNLGNNNDDYSETTTAVPLSGYPKAAIHDSYNQQPSDSYYGYTNNQHLDPWQHYGDSSASPQTPNTYDRRVKPDTVDYKPHQI
ncbi:unnamed protein product [Absidia cylindrospora]